VPQKILIWAFSLDNIYNGQGEARPIEEYLKAVYWPGRNLCLITFTY
jgi:hypothetical protein